MSAGIVLFKQLHLGLVQNDFDNHTKNSENRRKNMLNGGMKAGGTVLVIGAHKNISEYSGNSSLSKRFEAIKRGIFRNV